MQERPPRGADVVALRQHNVQHSLRALNVLQIERVHDALDTKNKKNAYLKQHTAQTSSFSKQQGHAANTMHSISKTLTILIPVFVIALGVVILINFQN